MNPFEISVERVFAPLAEQLGFEWAKTNERFEKFLEIKGKIRLRVYWYFERTSGVFATLVRPASDAEGALELSLYLLACYKSGSDTSNESRLASSESPADIALFVRSHVLPYLTDDNTDIDTVYDWVKRRVLEKHPEYNDLKTNKWVRCEWET